MTDESNLGPKPTTLTGGCLCAKLRYTVTLPRSHDFVKNAMTCQCTQCRRQSGALFTAFHRVPDFRWTSDTTTSLAEYGASAAAKRGFCRDCGSWLYYRGQDGYSICLGTVDPEILFGENGGGGVWAGAGKRIWVS
ncbi:glutathione-dependent formaldehyde-activating enzyme [Colletotrichum gloeosporioides Cg-14]|uniref:Glutathione-dependent formaldehyde-activating enzyme n=1 Tax=Colletotrichum gloeosporioides (strain Cg-14) TaxID=1237896 RepID=T0KYN6_COLGC|nr:glutathione-dependent formaldehyde-activating enzyme [Colletotrichum gloeosporioides Cg-14]